MKNSTLQNSTFQPMPYSGSTFLLLGLLTLTHCVSAPQDPADTQAALIAQGEDIFFNETFQGNGRTCGTCHPIERNFTIDPFFIATLPDDDPLFVAEFTPALRENFEKPRLMREFGLILENLDGFENLAEKFVLRGVPHVLAQRTSIESPQGPRTGWSGDGSPGDGSLRSFAMGAVIQHFPKTLNRMAGMDFRLPTDEELDALEAFMLSLGRQQELELPLPLKGTVALRGQEIFLDPTLGKCNLCHENAGANANIPAAQISGNANFNTGVEDLPDQPPDLTGELVPPDDGFGSPGDGTFNTPPLVEAADTGPFFHNNAIETIEGAVAFYNGDAFNNSPIGQTIANLDPNGVGIKLDATQVEEVAAFLRVINALENIRESLELLKACVSGHTHGSERTTMGIQRAVQEIKDAKMVLKGGGLHPEAVAHLRQAKKFAGKAAGSYFFTHRLAQKAIGELEQARALLVGSV
ncbi:MAG: hypothetical protein VST68_02455 [Nitrospirota bacterium]|nr:hypothetical protein [Nitrospirota bacterium]